MKRNIMTLLCLLLFVGIMPAQQTDKWKNNMSAKRPNFEAMQLKQALDVLNLDEQTAAKFTKVFKKYQADMRACHVPVVRKRTEDMTDAEIEQEIENQFKQGHKLIHVKEKYYKEFKKILTMKHIRKIYRLERMTMKMLNREMHRRSNINRPASLGCNRR